MKILFIGESTHCTPRIPRLIEELTLLGVDCSVVTGSPFSNANFNQILIPIESIQRKLANEIKLDFSGGTSGSLKRKMPLLPTSFIEFSVRQFRGLLSIPDEFRSWIYKIHRGIVGQINVDEFDFIISSSSPVSAHFAAKRLHRSTGVPWIADLRDLWSDNHNYNLPLWRKHFDRLLEKNCLKDAAALITVNSSWRDLLEEKYKQPVYLIENACMFNKKEYIEISEIVSRPLTLISVGPIYPGDHNLSLLLAGVKKFQKTTNVRVQLQFYGPPDSLSESLIRKAFLEGVEAFHHGNFPPEKVWRLQCSADALILFTWKPTGTAIGHIPLRYYEFLSTQNPIITMHSSANLVSSANSLASHSMASNVDDVVRFLENLQKRNVDSFSENVSVDFDLTYASRAKALSELLSKLQSG